uniref:Uncharacterized protein n=1 Tax=Cacopsylla melanoneura TaxID=428564 RepID=A0A8D8ZBY1_9HEMI
MMWIIMMWLIDSDFVFTLYFVLFIPPIASVYTWFTPSLACVYVGFTTPSCLCLHPLVLFYTTHGLQVYTPSCLCLRGVYIPFHCVYTPNFVYTPPCLCTYMVYTLLSVFTRGLHSLLPVFTHLMYRLFTPRLTCIHIIWFTTSLAFVYTWYGLYFI